MLIPASSAAPLDFVTGTGIGDGVRLVWRREERKGDFAGRDKCVELAPLVMERVGVAVSLNDPSCALDVIEVARETGSEGDAAERLCGMSRDRVLPFGRRPNQPSWVEIPGTVACGTCKEGARGSSKVGSSPPARFACPFETSCAEINLLSRFCRATSSTILIKLWSALPLGV